jgi:hypothetical protein
MSKRKQKAQRTRQQTLTPGEPGGERPRAWTVQHTLLAMAIGLVLVIAIGTGGALFQNRTPDAPSPATTAPAVPGAPTDAYGRTPDDPHYGHAHP